MLASDLGGTDTLPQSSGPISWFESFPNVDRVSLDSLASVDKSLPAGIAGPIEPAVGEWIVQLTDSAAKSLRTLGQGNALLNRTYGDFTIISGLGIEGLLLVRGRGATKSVLESSLGQNENVQSFSLNQLIQGQSTTPNDPEFVAGLMPGMERIDATNAWDVSRGSSSTVVGVVDTGIDPTHPDLYLNMWLNQGEIPKKYLDDDGPKLVDIDNDGLITFYDLNNVTRSAAAPYSLVFGGFTSGPNASFVSDLNNNGRIEASDLLADANWADGRDTDNNGFFDDFFGVNFRTGAGDPFAANNPSDELGHGTHVAGTIGAIGGNATGVVGVNWQTSLMSLRILDNNNQGDSGAAIRAINYAREMRERYRVEPNNRVSEGANVRVLNNSWGQPGGFEVSLETAIQDSSDAGILFVAASGNGNFLGQGVDNDRTPFYPAGYEAPGVIAVAASDTSDRPASFSNYGAKSVDIFAPGVGIRSTLPGGGYGSANGTSMATPHVAGTAALIWSAFPEATVAEVERAILSTVDPVTNGTQSVSTGGRLGTAKAINADVFAPAARLVSKQNITTAGGKSTQFKVEYSHRGGIDTNSLGNDDLVVKRQWGPDSTKPLSLVPGSIVTAQGGNIVTADYEMQAPGSEVFNSRIDVKSSPKALVSFSNNVPVPIDSNSVNTITSEINVENVNVIVSNFTVTLNIEHTYDSDLEVTLIAPNGLRAQLFKSVGDDKDNFTGTIFDDSSLTSITQAKAPFTGTFRPQQNISSLAATGVNGVWTLEVKDMFAEDGGQLVDWAIKFLDDFVPLTTQSEILVKDVSESVGNFSIALNATQTAFRNATATLIGPDGSRAVLFSNLTADFQNQVAMTFDDSGAVLVSDTVPLLSGVYRPVQLTAPLGASGPNGIWSLEIVGIFTARVDSLLTWSLDFVGSWDPLDFGEYVIDTIAGKVKTRIGNSTTDQRSVGGFKVRIEDPSVLYVDKFADSLEPGTLRRAIIEANSVAPAPRTIILESGRYTIDIPAVVDPSSKFGTSLDSLGIDNPGDWSNSATGDFDIEGNVTIVGDINDRTIIDAQGTDRAFKVHANSSLTLSRLSVQGGISPATQGGGGILSIGNLDLDQAILRNNTALGLTAETPIFGGAIASWNGNTLINQSWLTENKSDFGGALYYGGIATATVLRSTIDTNTGGGIYSTSSENGKVEDSTLSSNSGGYGAIANGIQNGFLFANRSSFPTSLSADGRFVVFESGASNLVSGDTNGVGDIFVYDRTTGKVERVSVSDSGVQGDFGSNSPSLSANGRYVTFFSLARNLVSGDSNGADDIFVFDRTTKKVERVSISDAGVEGNSSSFSPSLSEDGRYVTFESYASNLVPGDTNGVNDIFVYDRTTRKIERVSVSDESVEGKSGSFSPSLSADGRYVTFESYASNLVAGDTNGVRDIFVYDRTTRKIERVSVSDAGEQGNDISISPSLSADGRYVTFDSYAINLVPGDTNELSDIFVYDRTNKKIERVNLGDSGVQGDFDSYSPLLSEDGRYVTFYSDASNLVPGDTNGVADIFVFDRTTEKIERVSVSDTGEQGNNNSRFSSISEDGRFVAFYSDSSNLVNGDINKVGDVYLYDLTSRSIESSTIRPIKSVIEVISSTIAFTSVAIVNSAVYGDVKVNNSLFVPNTVNSDLTSRLPPADSYSNIFLAPAQSSFISLLQRSGTLPPVHHLINGNPAINSAVPSRNGSPDQLGNIRVISDVGAVEATNASIGGKVYLDANHNGRFDTGERGIPDVTINVTGATNAVITSRVDNSETPLVNESGLLDLTELPVGVHNFDAQVIPGWSKAVPSLKVIGSEAFSFGFPPSLNADGRYVTFSSVASNLVPGDTNGVADVFVYDQKTEKIERVSVSDAGEQGNDQSFAPSLSKDGRFVTFHSVANNLVPGDTTGQFDVFVYDRTTKKIERVSVSNTGGQGSSQSDSPSLSADGRYVTFGSRASNLVPGDTNDVADIFVYDRTTKNIERVNVSAVGEQGNGNSYFPSLSADGRYVTFESIASNLVPADTNEVFDIFVYDRTTKSIERVNVSAVEEQGTLNSYSPSLSADGRYVAFGSYASNLVPGDTNDVADIFVYDRTTKKIERVSVNDADEQGNFNSFYPSLSADGRFVSFESYASNLIPGDTNEVADIFVCDRTTKKITRVSVGDSGAQGDFDSYSPLLSADGRYVTFYSNASNLVAGALNGLSNTFVTYNPLAGTGQSLELQAGDVYTDLNIGLVPDPGMIDGKAFEDTVANGVFDSGETAVANTIVFLDLNVNGVLDAGERSVITTSDGTYQFSKIDSYQSYSIVIKIPNGYEQISPSASDKFVWNIFLPAGGTVANRDFAFRKVQSTGQSSASAVSGRLYDDRNGNKVFDAGDIPIANREVYLDATNFGTRDSDEPRVLTDAQGLYSIDGLSSRTVAVTTTLDETLSHVSPLGSNFSLQKFPLFRNLQPFGNPQAIAAGDFNFDGFQDVAVALGEGNKLSIRLNDKLGGFLPDAIDIDLGNDGAGPTALVVGQFDNDAKLDVALTANYASKVTVLLNFNPATKSFASQSAVAVGLLPIDIVAGQFGGDAKLDLVVVNKGAGTVGSTVQVLTNNGNGVFSAGPPIPTGGKDSVSLVAGNFTGDANLDVAVVHASPSATNTPFGGVTVLRGNGAGDLNLEASYYQVGAVPIDSVTADFNSDGRADIAVANFSSNSISILLGQANGTFRVQSAILGTASGAFDIALGDIDNDGDTDVIASNLVDRNISIFRNVGVDTPTGDVRFEPLENVGLGQFALAQRMPLVVANLDNDTSGPAGTGTVDIVTIPQRTDTLHVLKNKLVNGTRRVALTGLNRVSGLDFIIKSAILPPLFNEITNPAAIVEDSVEQLISITGIKKGRATGPALRFTTTSSNPALIASPLVSFTDGSGSATLRYTTTPNANGASVITLRAIDAGANQTFDDDDDGVFERTFTVTVLAVNDAPTMTIPPITTVTQKAGAQSIANFVTGISPGGGSDESGQILSAFTVTTDASFFTVQPSIDASGALLFTPNSNNSGSVIVTVTLTDNGGRASGGVDSTTRNFVINILPVNDSPSFNLGEDLFVEASAGLQTHSGFATGFLPGGGSDEASQSIAEYVVTVDTPRIFEVLPKIDKLGTLTFTPALDRSGIAIVSVRVRDDGGTLNGGNDLSVVKTFRIVSGAAKTIKLNASELGAHEVAIRNGLLTVTSGGNTIWSLPAADISKITTVDGIGATLYEVAVPIVNLPGTIRFTGAGKPIELIVDRTAVDLSVLTSDKLFGMEVIDLQAAGPNSLAFRSTDVSALNGSKTLRILMDSADTLSTLGSWVAQAGRLENGTWIQPFTNAGARIEVISATPWQNKVNRFDVDSDLTLSPLDVLVLVNLINANSFPNGQLPARGSTQPDGFFDPDGDNSLGPLDVLTLINEINRGSGGTGGEGENRSQWVDEVMATEFGKWGVEMRPVGLARRKLGNRR